MMVKSCALQCKLSPQASYSASLITGWIKYVWIDKRGIIQKSWEKLDHQFSSLIRKLSGQEAAISKAIRLTFKQNFRIKLSEQKPRQIGSIAIISDWLKSPNLSKPTTITQSNEIKKAKRFASQIGR